VAKTLRLPVILVVGLRLGCLNHAILSARAIKSDGCEFIGWIGNGIDPAMQRVRENIDTLRQRLPAPCLGILPYAKDRDARRVSAHLRDAVTAISAACPSAP
jgi:dethiobiotin synthetase